MPQTLVVAAALLGVLMPGRAHGQDAIAIAQEVGVLSGKNKYADAAAKAAEGAASDRFDAESRVLLGGLARENYAKSFKKGRDPHDLCGLAKVMRLVAALDSDASAAARQQMTKAAEDAEAQLQNAMGDDWRLFCGVMSETEGSMSRTSPPVNPPATAGSTGEPRLTSGTSGLVSVNGKSQATPVAVVTAAPTAVSPPVVVDRGFADGAPPDTSRRRQAGLGLMLSGLTLLVPMTAPLVLRGRGEAELRALREEDRILTAVEETRAASLRQQYRVTTAAAVTLGVAGAAMVVTGAVLLATRGRSNRVAVAPWGARGVGGLVLAGRF